MYITNCESSCALKLNKLPNLNIIINIECTIMLFLSIDIQCSLISFRQEIEIQNIHISSMKINTYSRFHKCILQRNCFTIEMNRQN